ncbi:hypothetical protein AAC387_Pa11g1136 [Persea americana]
MMIAEMRGDYDVEVKGVQISPDPVVRGKLATFNISASTSKFMLPRFVILLYFVSLLREISFLLIDSLSSPLHVTLIRNMSIEL